MKILKWLSENILFVITLFLLAFIPLYPKLPIFGVEHTWVYIRIEDFLVLGAIIIFLVQLIRKKANIKAPVVIPIILFLIVGAVSTVHAIFFVFPHLANVFPNVAVFHYLRRIEYMSLFFVAFAGMKNKRFMPYVVAVLAITLLIVVLYGLGQKGFIVGVENRFPAFSTMNEEFAKGIPLRLSAFARIPSTFAGHYDLAAYLVLLIAIMGSMAFGFKKWFVRIAILGSAILGLILLLLTASRVSFAVYLVTIVFMLVLQKKKIFIFPVIIGSILLLNSFQGISERFGSTISQVDLVVDARTGKAIGIVKKSQNKKIVVEEKQSTGESLPQGSGNYISLPTEPTEKTITEVLYKRSRIVAGTESAQVTNIEGDFVVKRVLAYDVSFTTRFQGEWPRAMEAFNRNALLGSGYSSISLATDNNYLRTLGEIGVLGLAAFIFIFLIIAVYVRRVIGDVDSKLARSFIIGAIAGVFGLGLNAILIDVFEASKVALTLWMILGIALGTLYLYQKKSVNYFKDVTSILTSKVAILVYLLIASFVFFAIIIDNYFVGDDFTWLRNASDCKKVLYASGVEKCEPVKEIITKYFTNADGFFYRPGTKLYFLMMQAVFWFNHEPYHVASILIHFVAASLVFFLILKMVRSRFFAFLAAIMFVVLSGNTESIFWISATGNLIATTFILFSLLMFIYWKETRNWIFIVFSFVGAILAPLFHEFGIIAPIIILLYDLVISGNIVKKKLVSLWYYLLYLVVIPIYLCIRDIAKSHWFYGDYSYSLHNFIFNFFGNLIGYVGIILIGAKTLPFMSSFRSYGKGHVFIMLAILVVFFAIVVVLYRFIKVKISKKNLQMLGLGIIFFVVPLLPFLGLGNISMRYAYPASFGLIFLTVFFMQKLYQKIQLFNKYVATGMILAVAAVFISYHASELKRINKDWYEAGQLTRNLLRNFNDRFPPKTLQNPVFYFVNVPISHNDAWVFPVGLPDALWITFQNVNLTVHVEKSLDLALDQIEGSASAKVFEFDKNGNVEEVVRTKETKIVPINKN